MRYLAKILAAPTLSALLITLACEQNRYEIKEDKLGRTIRLDKRTGEVAVIAGDKLIKLKTPEDQAAAREAVERSMNWPTLDLPQLGGAKAELVTTWRDDRLHYQFTLAPVTKFIKEARSSWPALKSLTVGLYDEAGFKVLQIPLSLSEFSTTVNDKSEPINLNVTDSAPCGEEQYRHIRTWNVQWSGFGPR